MLIESETMERNFILVQKSGIFVILGQNVALYFYLPRRRRPGTGDIATLALNRTPNVGVLFALDAVIWVSPITLWEKPK